MPKSLRPGYQMSGAEKAVSSRREKGAFLKADMKCSFVRFNKRRWWPPSFVEQNCNRNYQGDLVIPAGLVVVSAGVIVYVYVVPLIFVVKVPPETVSV